MKRPTPLRPFQSSTGPLALVLITLVTLAPSGQSLAADPKDDDATVWVERMNRALNPGRTMTATLEIRTIWDREKGTGLVADYKRRTGPEGSWVLLVVREPEEARGAAYQIRRSADGSLERWVWEPFLRRLRRIAGIQRTDPFLGTEFSYEDIGLAIPVERARGEVHRIEEDGRTLVRLDSPPYHYYSRVVTVIDPTTDLPVRVSFFDGAGQRFRVQTFDEVQEIQGHAFPTRIRKRDLVTDAESTLRFLDVRIDAPLPAETFEESEIQRLVTHRAKDGA